MAFNPFRIIVYKEVKESHSLYVRIYIFCMFVSLTSFFFLPYDSIEYE